MGKTSSLLFSMPAEEISNPPRRDTLVETLHDTVGEKRGIFLQTAQSTVLNLRSLRFACIEYQRLCTTYCLTDRVPNGGNGQTPCSSFREIVKDVAIHGCQHDLIVPESHVFKIIRGTLRAIAFGVNSQPTQIAKVVSGLSRGLPGFFEG